MARLPEVPDEIDKDAEPEEFEAEEDSDYSP